MRYTRKIMRLDLSAEKPASNGYYYTELLLPAEDYEIRDAMQQLRAIGREDSVWISILECSDLPMLENVRLDSPTLDELNFFAKRLVSMTDEDRIVFDAVIGRVIPDDAEGKLISMKDLINSTYGLDTVMIASNVGNDEQLGQFVIEEDINEDVASVPDNALYLLDRKQIGRLQREIDGGIYVNGFYVVAGDYEMPEVYDGKTLPHEEPSEWFAFRLHIAEAPVNSADETAGSAEWINLPIDKAEADKIAQKHNEGCIEDCVCYGFKSSIPQITESNFRDMDDFENFNRLAKMMLNMSPSDQTKFKAALEAEPHLQYLNVLGFLDIAEHLNEYELSYYSDSAASFYKDYLRNFMDSRFDSAWLDTLLTQNEGERLLQRLGAAETPYGVISARGHSLYELVSYDGPEVKELSAQGMTDEKLDVIEVLDRRALFANGRLLPEEIPEGLYAYDLRESDDGDRFVSIEPKVGVNHGGTVLMKEMLDFGESGYIPLDEDSDPNFLGYTMTPQEFAGEEQAEGENQEFGGMQL